MQQIKVDRNRFLRVTRMENMSNKFTPIFKPTDWCSINKVALPLLSKTFSGFCPGGTAVMISQYLAITARHVVDAYFKNSEGTLIPQAEEDQHLVTNHLIQAAQILENGEVGALWNIEKWWPSNHTDIAFLFLTPGNQAALDYKGHPLSMNLLPPCVGKIVHGFGYHSAKIRNEADNTTNWKTNPTTISGIVEEIYEKKRDSINTTNWKTNPTTISGIVEEIYEKKRDSMLNWPSFRIHAKVENDMSGGPIFNKHGELCGLICSGTNVPEGEESIAYVTTLWPMMGTQLDIDRDGHPKHTKYRVLELARDNILKAKHWDDICLHKNDNGGIDVLLNRSL